MKDRDHSERYMKAINKPSHGILLFSTSWRPLSLPFLHACGWALIKSHDTPAERSFFPSLPMIIFYEWELSDGSVPFTPWIPLPLSLRLRGAVIHSIHFFSFACQPSRKPAAAPQGMQKRGRLTGIYGWRLRSPHWRCGALQKIWPCEPNNIIQWVIPRASAAARRSGKWCKEIIWFTGHCYLTTWQQLIRCH